MGTRGTVLIVEDDPDTAEMTECVLRNIGGCAVVRANSVTSAQSRIESARYCLIISDILLLDGSGIDLCRWIRSFDSETPILFYSAVPDDVEAQALAAGADAFVRKAADLQLLAETIRFLIEDYIASPAGLL